MGCWSEKVVRSVVLIPLLCDCHMTWGEMGIVLALSVLVSIAIFWMVIRWVK
jgi:hypothetical protein